MKNSIGLSSRSRIGVTNSEERLVCFGKEGYKAVIRNIQRGDSDEPLWFTTPLETLLIPGEFL